jgi:hypothetical protein
MNQYFDSRTEAEKTPLERVLTKVKQGLFWILLGVGVAGGIFYYRMPIREPVELQALIATATQKKIALEAERDRISNRIEWLKNEPAYLELAVRDELNKKKDGEDIVRFHD